MSITQIAYWLMLGVEIGLVIGFLMAWLTVARADSTLRGEQRNGNKAC